MDGVECMATLLFKIELSTGAWNRKKLVTVDCRSPTVKTTWSCARLPCPCARRVSEVLHPQSASAMDCYGLPAYILTRSILQTSAVSALHRVTSAEVKPARTEDEASWHRSSTRCKQQNKKQSVACRRKLPEHGLQRFYNIARFSRTVPDFSRTVQLFHLYVESFPVDRHGRNPEGESLRISPSLAVELKGSPRIHAWPEIARTQMVTHMSAIPTPTPPYLCDPGSVGSCIDMAARLYDIA